MAKMLYAFEISLSNADWLDEKSADRATIELARYYCALIDDAEKQMADFPSPESSAALQKTYAIAGPNLQKTLTSLGLNPESRGELTAREEKVVNPFDELKRKRQEKRATG